MSKAGKRVFIIAIFAGVFLLWLGFFLYGYLSRSKSSQADQAFGTKMPLTQREGHARVDQLVQTLTRMEKEKAKKGRQAPTRNFTVTQQDLNSYIDQEMKQHPPKGMKSLVVDLKGSNQISGTALVDFNQIKMPNNGFFASAAKKLLSGDRYITVDGTLTSHDNTGTFSITRAEIDGMPLPPSLVTMIVKHIGEKQNPPVDITKPFNLPYGIDSVEISNGHLRIKA